MIVLDAKDAYKLLGHDKYSEDIKYMCQQTYKFWFETYYKLQVDKYPNWTTIYNIYMNIAQGKDTYGFIKGFIAIESEQIVGYCSMNYNDYLSNESDKDRQKYTLWLSDVYVWEKFRNRGIAKNLIDKVNETAKQMNTQIYLACETELIKFYTNQGWKLLTNVNKIYNYWNVMTFNDI